MCMVPNDSRNRRVTNETERRAVKPPHHRPQHELYGNNSHRPPTPPKIKSYSTAAIHTRIRQCPEESAGRTTRPQSVNKPIVLGISLNSFTVLLYVEDTKCSWVIRFKPLSSVLFVYVTTTTTSWRNKVTLFSPRPLAERCPRPTPCWYCWGTAVAPCAYHTEFFPPHGRPIIMRARSSSWWSIGSYYNIGIFTVVKTLHGRGGNEPYCIWRFHFVFFPGDDDDDREPTKIKVYRAAFRQYTDNIIVIISQFPRTTTFEFQCHRPWPVFL